MQKLKAGWIGYLTKDDDLWSSLETLSKLGYKGFEDGSRLLHGDVDENVKRLHDLGLEILTVSAGLDKMMSEGYEDVISRARKLGSPRATMWVCAINASFSKREPDYDEIMRDIENMEKAAAVLKGQGIKLCYHNHYQDFTVCYKGLTCLDLLLQNTQDLRIELDIGWVTNGWQVPARVMERIIDRIELIHVKDYRNGAMREKEPVFDVIHTTIGNGILDLDTSLEAAARLGIEWAVAEQDVMRNLSSMESLTAAYLNMKETGFVQ